jgi:hypothetical protein
MPRSATTRSRVCRIAAALALVTLLLPAAAFAGGAASYGGRVKRGLSGQAYLWQAGTC